jgi:hypothetical protein
VTPMASDTTGGASGYSVEEDPEDGFIWSAYGPGGTREGRTETHAEAESAARAAEVELKHPVPRET